MKKKQLQFFLVGLLVSQLILAACTAMVPIEQTVVEATPTQPSPTETPTQEPTQIPEPTATELPSIEITDKLLKGLDITVRHPFIENTAEFDQMIRDFNLINLWGIHVTGVASGGNEGLKNDLFDGLVFEDLVIGMGYDLLAAQPDTQFLAVDDYARDARFGVTSYFDALSPFSGITPKYGESVHYSVPLAYNAGILLYNTTWAEEMGFPKLPTDQNKLLEIARAAVDDNLADDDFYNNGTGGVLLSQSPQAAVSWYSTYLSEVQDPDLLPQPEPLLGSFYFLKETYDANLSWIGMEPTPYRYFSNRYAVAAEGTLESLRYQAAYQRTGDFQDAWTTLAYPGVKSGGQTFLVVEPLSFAIQRSDQYSELAAWIFGIWLMEPAQQARLIEMHGLWPSTGNPEIIAPNYASARPYWTAALKSDPDITIVPETAEWSSKRLVFQDAYQRIYNLDIEYFISIVDVFDETTRINQEQRP